MTIWYYSTTLSIGMTTTCAAFIAYLKSPNYFSPGLASTLARHASLLLYFFINQQSASTTRKTRFVCLSDTHNSSPGGAFKLPKGDVLIHAGDLTNQGSYFELRKTIKWIEEADFEVKIVIAGNHDITLDTDFYTQHGLDFHNQNPQDSTKCRELLEKSSIYWLQHEAALKSSLGPRTTFKIFGSPLSPAKGLWAYGYNTAGAEDIWAQIPLDSDIILTHTPPKCHLDERSDRQAVECKPLRNALWRIRPLLAICGHIHESRGAERVRWDLDVSNIKYKELSVERWTDPALHNKKVSLVDLSGSGKPLDNDGSIGLPNDPGTHVSSNPSVSSEVMTALDCQGRRGIPPSPRYDLEALTGRMERRETCIINAAIMASSWPHGPGGKKFKKPIVVDIDLPVYEGLG